MKAFQNPTWTSTLRKGLLFLSKSSAFGLCLLLHLHQLLDSRHLPLIPARATTQIPSFTVGGNPENCSGHFLFYFRKQHAIYSSARSALLSLSWSLRFLVSVLNLTRFTRLLLLQPTFRGSILSYIHLFISKNKYYFITITQSALWIFFPHKCHLHQL